MLFPVLICIAHLVRGVLLWWEPAGAPVTAEWSFYLMAGVIGPQVVGTLLIASSCAAFYGIRTHRLRWLLPQQFLFGLAFSDAARAMWAGVFPDGYAPVRGNPHRFILRDQLLMLLMVGGYVWSVAGLYANVRRRKLP